MHPESAIIERVEILIRHPIFEGSGGIMEEILRDLGSLVSSRRIGHETYRRLREMILRSPHIASFADHQFCEHTLV
jgi:hypothetical protein